MSRKAALVFTAVVCSLSYSNSLSAFSQSDLCTCFKFCPYVGLDAQIRHMTFEEGYGDNTLRHSSPQGNGYVGLRFHDYFAAELGYESTVTRARTKTLYAGELAAGTLITEMVSPAIFRSKIKMEGPHLNLLGLYPLYDCCGTPIEILGSVGVSFLKGTSQRKTLSRAGVPSGMTRTLVGKKTVLRASMGLQYMIGEHLGIRGTVGWVDTSKLVIFANDNIPGRYLPEVKPKGTAFCGLGLLWAL